MSIATELAARRETVGEHILRLLGASIGSALIAVVPVLREITYAVWSIFDAIARDSLAASSLGGLESFVIVTMPYLLVGSILLSLGYSAVIAVESRIRS